MKTNPLRCLAIAALLAEASASAATRQWDGSAGTNWTTAANWTNSVAPVAGDTLLFPASGLNKTNFNNFPAGTVFGQIRLTDDYVLNGNPVALTNGVFLGIPLIGIANATINHAITLNHDQTFTAAGADRGGSSRLTLRSTLNLNGNLLDTDGGGTVELAGNVTGSSALIQTLGPGTLIFSTNAVFSGRVIVYDGVARVDGNLSSASVDVFPDVPGTLVGTGSVAGLFLSGILSPGLNGPGRLTTISNVHFANSLFIAQLNGTNAGVDYDQLKVQGTVTAGVNPGSIQVILGYQPRLGDRFIVVDNDGTDPLEASLQLEGASCGANYFTTNGYTLQLVQPGGDGNDVEVVVIREPASPIAIWAGEASELWSDGSNWIGGGVPSPGQHLRFTELSCIVHSVLTNDRPAGTTFASLWLSQAFGQAYALRGNSIRLTSGITNTATTANNGVFLPIELTANQAFHCEDAPLFIIGALSGAGGLIKTGPGEIVFAGISTNTYAGGTFVNEGTLQLAQLSGTTVGSGPLTIGDGAGPGTDTLVTYYVNQFPANTAVTINSSGLLDLDGNADTIASLTMNGGRVQTGAAALTMGGNFLANASDSQARIDGHLNLFGNVIGFNVADGPLDVDAVIAAILTNGSLSKLGEGTFLLSGNNVHTGATTVNAGRLRVTGSVRMSALTVAGGSTLDGTGVVGPTTVTSGTIAPGTSTGLLRVSGNLTLSPLATLFVELNGLVPVSAHDQLSVTGAVNIAGATLAGSVGFASSPGNTFTILLNDGSDPFVGTFAGLPQGAVFLLGGQTFSISYTGGTGNDVVLTRVIGAASLSGPAKLANGQVQFQGLGEAGLSYLVQANTNLGTTNWLNLGSAPANGTGLFQFLDTNAPHHPKRFYRAVSP